jgi:hypothetical protein
MIIKNLQNLIFLFRHCVLELFKYKKFSSTKSYFLNKKGFYIFKINSNKIDHIKELVEKEVNKFSTKKRGDKRFHGIELENVEIREFINGVLNQEIKFIKEVSTIKRLYAHNMMGGNLSENNGESSGGGWHIDHSFEQFKLLIYLNDVDNENGPFSYIERSHKKLFQFLCLLFFKLFSKNITRFNFFTVKLIKLLFFKKQKIITGPKGTAVVFNSSGLHRGLSLVKDNRVSLTAYIFPHGDYDKNNEKRNDKFNIPKNLRNKQINVHKIL